MPSALMTEPIVGENGGNLSAGDHDVLYQSEDTTSILPVAQERSAMPGRSAGPLVVRDRLGHGKEDGS